MTKPTRNVLYLTLAVLMIAVSVQRFRAHAARQRAYYGYIPGFSERYRYLSQLGPASPKLRTEGDRTLLWARGKRGEPQTEWFDITGAPLPPAELQYGIGKDKIPAIDEPEFLAADDPRLAEAGIGDDTSVIGYAHAGQAKAYPIPILNRHELVNDRVGGKPVTVGW